MLSNRQKHKISVRFAMSHGIDFKIMDDFVNDNKTTDEEEFEINLYERFVKNGKPGDKKWKNGIQ